MAKTTTRMGRRTIRLVAAGTIAATVLGCGSDKSTGAMTADLERDLAMASSAARPQTQVVSAIEGGPVNAPSGEQRGRRDDVVRPRRAPLATPHAHQMQEAPAPTQVAEAPAPAAPEPQAEPAPAPAPAVGNEAPAPRPTWGVIYDDGATTRGPSDGRGSAGTGSGRDGGWGNGGGMGGVIIRGGGAGEDHCEPRGGMGRRGGRMPVGIGGGMGMGGIIGGIIGGGAGRGTFPRY